MSTVVFDNESSKQTIDDVGFGGGLLLGLLIFVVFISALLYFGIPVFNRMQVNVPASPAKMETTQVVVPKKIKVIPAN